MSMSMPKFCIDGEHRAALVLGRATELGPFSDAQVRACVDIAIEHGKRTGLPLAFVIATAPGEEASYAGAAAGLVVADAREGIPCEVSKASLDRQSIGSIPDAFWSALAQAGATFAAAGEDDDPEEPKEGLFLVPAGWSIARLKLGKTVSQEEIDAAEDAGEDPPESTAERVLGCAAEDTFAPRLVTSALIARVRASSEPLMLEADYC